MARRRDIPQEVEQVAETVDRGVYIHDVIPDMRDRDDWSKIAACGQPYYIHESGWAIVSGARNKTAVISPNQMEKIPDVMVGYFRVMNDQNPVSGVLDRDSFIELSLVPEDDEYGFDREALYERLESPKMSPAARGAIQTLYDEVDSE